MEKIGAIVVYLYFTVDVIFQLESGQSHAMNVLFKLRRKIYYQMLGPTLAVCQ